MPIVEADIEYRLSVPTATEGDADPQANPNASLGKHVATTELDLVVTLNNLFRDITGDESLAGVTLYRCIFVANKHATLSMLAPNKIWLQGEVSGGGSIAIGLDPAGNVPIDDTSDQAATVANETTAPGGVAFTSPTTKGTGLSIGELAPDEVRAVWVRLTVGASTSAKDLDGVTLRVECDTAE